MPFFRKHTGEKILYNIRKYWVTAKKKSGINTTCKYMVEENLSG